MIKFTIKGKLDGLNEYTRLNRTSAYVGNTCKKRNQLEVRKAIWEAELKPVKKYPVELNIKWYEPDKRRDIDNVVFAVKFIQDELVFSGILGGDGQKYIKKLTHTVEVDKENPRIEIEIRELE